MLSGIHRNDHASRQRVDGGVADGTRLQVAESDPAAQHGGGERVAQAELRSDLRFLARVERPAHQAIHER